jgi:hypothetical protein
MQGSGRGVDPAGSLKAQSDPCAAACGRAVPLPLVLLLICLVPAEPAGAAGTRDLNDGWLIPARCLAPLLGGASAEQDPPGRGFWSWFAQGRLHGMPELPLQGAALGYARTRLTVSAGWERLGDGLYREESWRLRLAFRAGRTLVAVTGRREGRYVAGETGQVAGTLVLEARHGLGSGLELSLWHGLYPLASRADGRSLRRWLLLSGHSQLAAWAVALDRDGEGAPSWQVAGLLALAAGVAMGVRSEPATGTIGLTTAWRWGRWCLRSSHLVHPELGLTHRWGLLWGCPEALP